MARIAGTFWVGYHASLADPRPEQVLRALEPVERGWRGFAFEGVGMAFTLLDALLPWPARRLPALLAGPAGVHRYLLYVGVGFALARLRRGPRRVLRDLDPFCHWIVFDGYGFYQGFFASGRRGLAALRVPRRVRGYARRSFDRGLGRSLWFVGGMDPRAVAAQVEAFPAGRRGDVWSGIGLACAYAAGLPAERLGELVHVAGLWRSDLLQGVAFAATARAAADDQARHTDEVCRVLCGVGADELAAWTVAAARDLPEDGGPLDGEEPAWEVWRSRVRLELAGS